MRQLPTILYSASKLHCEERSYFFECCKIELSLDQNVELVAAGT